MIRWIRVVLPSSRLVNFALGAVVFICVCIETGYRALFFLYGDYFSAEGAQALADGRRILLLGLLLMWCLLYGGYRAIAFHPLYIVDYQKWLRSTPWTSRKSLPSGPVHLVLQDAVIVIALTVVAVYGLDGPWYGPLLAVLLPYLLCLGAMLADSGELGACYILGFGFVALTYFLRQPAGAVGLTLALYAVAYAGFRRSLARFPWDRQPVMNDVLLLGIDRTDSANRFLSFSRSVQRSHKPSKLGGSGQLSAASLLGWPLNRLNPLQSIYSVHPIYGILVSLLIGWVVFAVSRFAHGDKQDFAMLGTFWIMTVHLALLRVYLYCLGYASPISFWGRIFTGRWIIPGYDVVFVAPVCAFLTSIVAPLALTHFGLPLKIAIPISTSLMLMVLILPGPRLGRWRLTGKHRIVPGFVKAHRSELFEI